MLFLIGRMDSGPIRERSKIGQKIGRGVHERALATVTTSYLPLAWDTRIFRRAWSNLRCPNRNPNFEIEEKTRSCLHQTGSSFSSNSNLRMLSGAAGRPGGRPPARPGGRAAGRPACREAWRRQMGWGGAEQIGAGLAGSGRHGGGQVGWLHPVSLLPSHQVPDVSKSNLRRNSSLSDSDREEFSPQIGF